MAKNRTLECTHSNDKIYGVGKLWDKFEIITLPLLDIWATSPNVDVLVGKPFKKTLIDDIKKNGMYWPIMVVKTDGRTLIKAKEEYGKKINPLPFWQSDSKNLDKTYWSCWGGSQRIDVALRLNYTHISAAVLPNIKTAIQHQQLMRKPYLKKYYEN